MKLGISLQCGGSALSSSYIAKHSVRKYKSIILIAIQYQNRLYTYLVLHIHTLLCNYNKNSYIFINLEYTTMQWSCICDKKY